MALIRKRSKNNIKKNVEHKDTRVTIRKIKHNVKPPKKELKKALDKNVHLPVEIFEKTLEFMKTTNIGDDRESLIKNNSLKLCVSKYSHLKQSSFQRYFITAKVCLLNRDWKNLSRILRICTQDRRFTAYSSIIQKYIFMLITREHMLKNESLLEAYLKSCLHFKSEQQCNAFVKTILSFPTIN